MSIGKEFKQTKRKIIQLILVFLGIILLLLAYLINQNYSSLKRESIYNIRSVAEEGHNTLSLELEKFISEEEARPGEDYSFFSIYENNLVGVRGLKISPLSGPWKENSTYGITGYFQLSKSGKVTSPILPDSDRETLNEQSKILSEEELQARGNRLDLIKRIVAEANISFRQRGSTKFDVVRKSIRELILTREVRTQGEEYIQGIIIDPKVFFENIIFKAKSGSESLQKLRITVTESGRLAGGVFRDRVLGADITPVDWLTKFNTDIQILSSLAPKPFTSINFVYTLDELPYSQNLSFATKLYIIVILFFIGGTYFIYRLIIRHLSLAEERTNFISAVSHELKTPLTSIRMYAEMLLNDWVKNDEKRKEHYKYIHNESERLSRLINNVLDFARLSKQQTKATLEPISAEKLLQMIKDNNEEKIKKSGYQLKIDLLEGDDGKLVIHSDKDALSQIFINLIDNALKFSKDSEDKVIRVGYRLDQNRKGLEVFVRDYGQGVPEGQSARIFELFYRAENELTRNTTGVGIGLALVKELAASIGAEVSVKNCSPGAEFSLFFAQSK